MSAAAGSLRPDLQALAAAARAACRNAYAPYSGFPVGSAVLAADGSIYAGANVENASHGLTVCAERNAIARAVAAGARELVALVIYTPTTKPTPPCGACRQVLREFGPDARVHSLCDSDQQLSWSLDELLPHSFHNRVGPA